MAVDKVCVESRPGWPPLTFRSMPDSIPLIPQIVRHRPGPTSVTPPEWCPPSLRNRTQQLDLRNIKTTLGNEVLQYLTPQMVQKELWVSLLAYNLIRLLMAQAAQMSANSVRW